MSEQDSTQYSTKQRRSRKTSIANQHNGKQAPAVQRPANDDTKAWKAYWEQQGQPWRTEPEIDNERQKYLAERRNIKPNIEQGIYPFKDIKLNRADVEWLLATLENSRGPVDWNDQSQRERVGLDLRGADLRQATLTNLPLACLRGGLDWQNWLDATPEQRLMAEIHLENADLRTVHLEGAKLCGAHLEKTGLAGAYLQYAFLRRAYLERAALREAHLEGVNLREARLDYAFLRGAYLAGASLRWAHLEGAYLSNAHLEGKEVVASGIEFTQKEITIERLPPADLRLAYFNKETRLDLAILGDKKYGFVSLADLSWGDANLTVVDWTLVSIVGDEQTAQQTKRLDHYQMAARANRQLAIALQGQGLTEDAARFNYRAQLMQRKVFWYERRYSQYLFSLFLDILTGYGYKPIRSFITYAAVISVFAIIYFLLGSHLAWNEAIVISMTAFHGRGFFPDQFHPGDPQALVAAIEAFVGLLIEVTFIATLTQRLFGK